MTVNRIGGTLAVVIPRAIAAASRLGEGTPFDLSSTPAGILFQHPSRRPRRPIAQIVKRLGTAADARRSAERLAEPAVGTDVG